MKPLKEPWGGCHIVLHGHIGSAIALLALRKNNQTPVFFFSLSLSLSLFFTWNPTLSLSLSLLPGAQNLDLKLKICMNMSNIYQHMSNIVKQFNHVTIVLIFQSGNRQLPSVPSCCSAERANQPLMFRPEVNWCHEQD